MWYYRHIQTKVKIFGWSECGDEVDILKWFLSEVKNRDARRRFEGKTRFVEERKAEFIKKSEAKYGEDIFEWRKVGGSLQIVKVRN